VADLGDTSVPHPGYTVVARRYRPKNFSELIGQEHVAQALSNAIATGRVGHAYLFTGARGVGKTSTARIFAKALSITDSMASEVVDEICSAIDSGDDMDVLEIDGASNRGIEEIRQLRANVNVRPIRGQYKIYIIDEVHMLTTPAFNALLKTLEEPPEHVKFIFCTTDPNKIPITVLSRCQRFDFIPVKFEAIQQRLQEIANDEGYEVDPDALALLARQAAGSMRDSQSLLEQVMSFSDGKITAQQVHAMLGTADEENLLAIIEALQARSPLVAVEAVSAAIANGADSGQLAEQLLGYLRDLMALAVGGGPQILKIANPAGHVQLKQVADHWGLQSLLSAIQILDESIVRMRASVSAATLLEVALVQISQLEQLASIPALLEALQQTPPLKVAPHQPERRAPAPPQNTPPQNTPPQNTPQQETSQQETSQQISANQPASPPPTVVESGVEPPNPKGVQKKKQTDDLTAPVSDASEPIDSEVCGATGTNPSSDALSNWRRVTRSIDGILADYCQMAVDVHPGADGSWTIVLPPGAKQVADYLEQTDRKSLLSGKLGAELGREIRLSFELQPGETVTATSPPLSPTVERTKKLRELSQHPFIQKICEVLDAEIVRVHPGHPTAAKPVGSPQTVAKE
jgi:DNA polymerase III subunit gamma/tau